MKRSELDPIIHAPNRLQICAILSPMEEAEFRVIREELNVSDSVLSKHVSQLVEAGYVKIRKSTINSRQRTWAALTARGRKAFANHLKALQAIVDRATSKGSV